MVLKNGLSRMRGDSPVRFLGGGGAVMHCCYPTKCMELIAGKRLYGARSWAVRNGWRHCWKKLNRAARLAWKPVVAHITGPGNCKSEALP